MYIYVKCNATTNAQIQPILLAIVVLISEKEFAPSVGGIDYIVLCFV